MGDIDGIASADAVTSALCPIQSISQISLFTFLQILEVFFFKKKT